MSQSIDVLLFRVHMLIICAFCLMLLCGGPFLGGTEYRSFRWVFPLSVDICWVLDVSYGILKLKASLCICPYYCVYTEKDMLFPLPFTCVQPKVAHSLPQLCYLSSLFPYCTQNDVTSQSCSLSVGFKKPRPILLISLRVQNKQQPFVVGRNTNHMYFASKLWSSRFCVNFAKLVICNCNFFIELIPKILIRSVLVARLSKCLFSLWN